MGISISHAAPPPPPPVSHEAAHPLGLAAALPPPAEEKKDDVAEKVDYKNLPCPVPFEEIQREALSMKYFLLRFCRFLEFFCSGDIRASVFWNLSAIFGSMRVFSIAGIVSARF